MSSRRASGATVVGFVLTGLSALVFGPIGCRNSSSSGSSTAPSTPASLAAVDDAAETDEDVAIEFSPLNNDTGDGISIDQVGTTALGTLTVVGSDRLRFVPTPDASGFALVDYRIRDASGALASAQIGLTVRPVPDAPVAMPDSANVVEDGSVEIDVLSNDFEPDGETLDVSVPVPPTFGAVTWLGDRFEYVPDPDACGIDTFTYRAEDPTGLFDLAVVTIDVQCTDDAPVATPDFAPVLVGATITIDALANDTDADGDALELVAIETPPGQGTAQIISGEIRYVSTGAVGADSFTYRVEDPTGLFAIGTVEVDVRNFELGYRLAVTAPSDYEVGATPLPTVLVASHVDWDSAGLPLEVESFRQRWSYDADRVLPLEVVPGTALDPASGGVTPAEFTVTIESGVVELYVEFDVGAPWTLATSSEVAVATFEPVVAQANPNGIDLDFAWAGVAPDNQVTSGGVPIVPGLQGDAASIAATWSVTGFQYLLPARIVEAASADSIIQPLVIQEVGGSQPTDAFAVSIAHPAGNLTAVAFDVAGPVAALDGGQGPDFVGPQLYADGVTMGVVYSFPMLYTLEFSAPTVVAEIEYSVDPSLLGSATDPVSLPLTFASPIGAVPVEQFVAVGVVVYTPTVNDGRIVVLP